MTGVAQTTAGTVSNVTGTQRMQVVQTEYIGSADGSTGGLLCIVRDTVRNIDYMIVFSNQSSVAIQVLPH